MRVLILADCDYTHWTGGEGEADLVVACGDLVDEFILEAAAAHNCDKIFGVRGNHDIDMPFPDPIVDLHMKTVDFGGLRFGGFCGSWRYKPRGYYLFDQWEVDGLMRGFPEVDVFIAHNSPRNVHDRDDDVHYGFDSFGDYIDRCAPKNLIHGHQHVNRTTRVGDTDVVGVFGYRIMEI